MTEFGLVVVKAGVFPESLMILLLIGEALIVRGIRHGKGDEFNKAEVNLNVGWLAGRWAMFSRAQCLHVICPEPCS